MRKVRFLFCCIALTAVCSTTHAQLLKKLKEKAENAADKAIDKKVDKAVNGENANTDNSNNTSNNGPGMPSKNSKSNPSNKGGQGLISTPPNVNENLTSADASYKSGKYTDARYAIQQAMLGVELEIGQKILKSLPDVVAGLKKDTTADQVASTSWGWTGLTIHREYLEGEKQLRFTISNNSPWMQAVNLYLTNTGYMQTSGNQQNWKQIKVQDLRGVIEYDQSSGYKVSVPLGQTSLLVYEGVNFATEQDMMSAVNGINIEQIKKHLGEK